MTNQNTRTTLVAAQAAWEGAWEAINGEAELTEGAELLAQMTLRITQMLNDKQDEAGIVAILRTACEALKEADDEACDAAEEADLI